MNEPSSGIVLNDDKNTKKRATRPLQRPGALTTHALTPEEAKMASADTTQVRTLIQWLAAMKDAAAEFEDKLEGAIIAAEALLTDPAADPRDELYDGISELHEALERGDSDRQLLGCAIRIASLLDNLAADGAPS